MLSFIKNFKNVNKLSSGEFNPQRGIHLNLIHTKIMNFTTPIVPHTHSIIFTIYTASFRMTTSAEIEAPEGAEY